MSAVPKPPARSFPISAETLARIDACCAISGETPAQLVGLAVRRELETREAASAFRRASWFADLPALDAPPVVRRDLKPENMSPCSFVAPSDGAPELPLIPDLEAPSARPARAGGT
jgi:hypothetical protein